MLNLLFKYYFFIICLIVSCVSLSPFSESDASLPYLKAKLILSLVLPIFIFLSFLLILKLVGIHEHLHFLLFFISNPFFISNTLLHIGQENSITAVSLTISSFSSSVEETVVSVLFFLFFFFPIYINIYIFNILYQKLN